MSAHDPGYMSMDVAERISRKMKERNEKSRMGGKPMTSFRIHSRLVMETGIPLWLRLIPGKYTSFDGTEMPYYEYIDHFNATVNRGSICSRTWKDVNGSLEPTGGKCVPCHLIEEGSKNISTAQRYAFLALHLDWFYLLPAMDKKGNTIRYQRDGKNHRAGEVVMERTLESVAKKELGAHELKKYDKVFGKLVHWSMPRAHLTTLSTHMLDLRDTCACGGRISVVVWSCANCASEVIDLTGGSKSMSPSDARELAMSEPLGCKECGKKTMLVPVRMCNKCGKNNPLNLWDVNMYVSREGQKGQTQIIVRRVDHEDLDEACEKLIPDPEKGFLHRVFAPDDLERQAQAMKVPNPFATGRRQVEDYNKSDGSEEADIPY